MLKFLYKLTLYVKSLEVVLAGISKQWNDRHFQENCIISAY